MGTELMNLAGFKKGPAEAFAGHHTEESLADGIGGGYPLIRYGGKEWKLQLRGDVIQYTDTEGYGAKYIDVVILRQARNKSKAYFPNWEEGTKDAPVCTSMDGIVPDPGVEERQSTTCAGCPRNVFKPNERGMKVKECSDAKRLAVFPLIPQHMLGSTGGPVVEPTFLRVPAASLQNLAQMGEAARKAGYDYFMFVVRIDFDPEKNYPKMRFKGHQALSNVEAQAVLKLREDPQSYRIVSGELGGGMKAVAAPVEQVQLVAPTGDTGLVRDPAEVAESAQKASLAAKLAADTAARKQAIRAEAEAKEFAAAAKAKPAPKEIELKAEPAEPIDTGLGGLVMTEKSAEKPVQAVVADKGEPEQSDDVLDAAIAAFLPPQ